MSGPAVDSNRWRDFLGSRIPATLRGLIEGGSRRELLQQVDCVLLVFGRRLFNTGSGASIELVTNGASADEEIAAAAAFLMQGESGSSVLLLLPPEDFAVTSARLPNLARDTLASALRLQSDSLLPGLNQDLALAVNLAPGPSVKPHIALWFDNARLDRLFLAFAGRGIFLSAVMPRCTYLLPSSGTVTVRDEDQTFITIMTGENACVGTWLQVDKSDLQQDAFRQQWQQAEQESGILPLLACSDSTAWQGAAPANAIREYCFFPRGALNAERQVEKGKRLTVAGIAAMLLLLIGASPFLLQSLQLRSMASELEAAREFSAGPRQDRMIVQDFESAWGPVNDFPDQNIRDALFALQNILSPERLVSFEVSEGLIKIEGDSVEPQAILQRLDQDPMFTEVAFSRATSNGRYYIDLRLSAVNFEAYMVRYFAED